MLEKIKALEEAKLKLKSEFIGIDNIIDQIIENITPWYVTPEILEKPVVVSLWGLTGTGKTSVIRKLINYLDLSDKSIFFDCGQETNTNESSVAEKLNDLFDNSSDGLGDIDPFADKDFYSEMELNPSADKIKKRTPKDFIFVFDEFQYARTLDEQGKEIDKPTLRSVWNLMDHGVLDINSYQYDLNNFVMFIEELEYFSNEHPGLGADKGYFPNIPSVISELKDTLGLYYRGEFQTCSDGEEDGDKFELIPKEKLYVLMRRLNRIESGLGYKVVGKINSMTSLADVIELVKKYIKILTRPKILNCNKSLIFILGNLDEAFGVKKEIDPDVSADIFHEMTSNVGITDLKKALQEKFRDEQVGRLGNNIIKYPSLRKKDFEEIIDKELTRISNRFKEVANIELTFSAKMKKLVYSEGVYPTQGVRPVITTINSMINPKLSSILINKTDEVVSVNFDVKENNFDREKATIILDFWGKDKKIKSVNFSQELALGTLRCPSNCNKIAIHSVHEAAHAVIYSKLTGEIPTAIISISSMGGGYMWSEVDDQDGKSSDSIEELDNEIVIALAGYYGEREFYPEEKCTLGSSSDISTAWNKLAEAVYNCGYLEPIQFAATSGEIDHSTNSSFGISDDLNLTGAILDSKSLGSVKNVKKIMYSLLAEFQNKTEELVKSERDLILKIGLYLSKNRSMSESTYKRYIKKYAKTFSLEDMKKMKKDNEGYYLKVLKKK